MTTVDSWWTLGGCKYVLVDSGWLLYTLGDNARITDTVKRSVPFSSAMSSAICWCCGSHFLVLFLGFEWWGHMREDLLHQLGHNRPSKQRDIKVATGLSNRPPRGRSGRDLHRLHHTKNNITTKIGDFYPVALSCKAGHSSFMGDNLKERVQIEHCVCKRKGKQGYPFTELVYFCALLRALLPFPRPGLKN